MFCFCLGLLKYVKTTNQNIVHGSKDKYPAKLLFARIMKNVDILIRRQIFNTHFSEEKGGRRHPPHRHVPSQTPYPTSRGPFALPPFGPQPPPEVRCTVQPRKSLSSAHVSLSFLVCASCCSGRAVSALNFCLRLSRAGFIKHLVSANKCQSIHI